MYSAEKSKSPYVSYRKRQRGFTLVEFMVAMALGLVIMLAVSEIFVNNSQARSEIERVSRQIENGRFALQLLSDEIANAGFFGESDVQSLPSTQPAICLDSEADVRGSMALPISGGNNVAVADAPSCLGGLKADSDYIAIRRTSTCVAGSTGCENFVEGHFHLQVAACRDTTGAITPAHAVGDIVLARTSSGMTARTRTCASSPSAPIYRYLSRFYYVRDDDVLVRAELQDPTGTQRYVTTPLVDGIERLHFEYGLDSNGDGEADEYVSSVDAGDWEGWANVVVVRIGLLARTLEATPGYSDTNSYSFPGEDPDDAYTPPANDGFKRHLYTAVVRVNNVDGRRE